MRASDGYINIYLRQLFSIIGYDRIVLLIYKIPLS